ncbi:undecaprenyl-diphosphatase UppP [bacterium]|nr:undecaprenyl-diphosphatase UppP [bacterium]MBU1781861.1 undecaprenyl-diphosphatase UppP [bacterium]
MEIIKALILGLVQGLTEFLPVSSSGHLVIMQHYLNFPLPPLFFDIILHLGTLISVIYVFKDDLLAMLKSTMRYFRKKDFINNEIWFLLMIILGTIPTGIIGLLFKPYFERLFTSVLSVGFALVATAVILFLAEILNKPGKKEKINVVNALSIGIMQGVAIIPGISRSGITISTGIMQNINREIATKYSFLLSIPAILGAVTLDLSSANNMKIMSNHWHLYLGGGLVATVSGILAIKVLLWMLRRYKLYIFSVYCLMIGWWVIWESI